MEGVQKLRKMRYFADHCQDLRSIHYLQCDEQNKLYNQKIMKKIKIKKVGTFCFRETLSSDMTLARTV